MGIHGNDVVHAIREALKERDICPTMSEIRVRENPEMGWPSRDGYLEFDAIGRDWFRAFRITVEALPADEFRGEHGSDEWVEAG